ncbi:MAG: hypothetical protein IPK16_19155 [Anaerolineales bacterium]|nr:hypothetical protein [Anaerolineales bacterium]
MTSGREGGLTGGNRENTMVNSLSWGVFFVECATCRVFPKTPWAWSAVVFALISWTTLSSWFGVPREPAPAASPVATTAMGIESTTPVTVPQVTGGGRRGHLDQAGADMLAIWVSSVSSITALLGSLDDWCLFWPAP